MIALPPCSQDGLLQPNDPQTLATLQTATHELSGRDERIIPVPKHGLHVARYAFQDDGGDRHEGTVFFGDGEDAVFLCEHEGGGEGRSLAAS